jgi:hypothetical protein
MGTRKQKKLKYLKSKKGEKGEVKGKGHDYKRGRQERKKFY